MTKKEISKNVHRTFVKADKKVLSKERIDFINYLAAHGAIEYLDEIVLNEFPHYYYSTIV